jgi:hypothetical protein
MLLRRIVFHYTPPHGSWLNMAEIGVTSQKSLVAEGERDCQKGRDLV